MDIRQALPSDTPQVLDLTSHIWDGEDYVPHVWEEWLAEPSGYSVVAEYQGKLVGLCRLVRLSPLDWWLQALRVHPDFEGRGIAAQLHEWMLAHWQVHGNGTLRLATNEKRQPVHHLCERTGFHKLGEYSWFVGPGLEGGASNFIPLEPEEAGVAAGYAQNSPSLALSAGLMDHGWEYVQPTEAEIQAQIHKGLAFWRQPSPEQPDEPAGMLVVMEDMEEEPPILLIQLIACPLEEMASLLQDFRRLGAARGFGRVGWVAPMHPVALAALSTAGFQREWDSSIYLFAKEHKMV